MGGRNNAERRLAAILAADVVGYSRLMGRDEQGTLDRLKECRRALIDPAITDHRGRIVKTTGDGLLAEFPSVVAAVECALAVQAAMAERNAAIAEDSRMRLRIGINLGDIIVEEGDIFGDGVNVAARLQEVAMPGGVCVSDDAYRQVRGKLALNGKDLGFQRLKNIAEPVRAVALPIPGEPSAPSPSPQADASADKPSIAVLPFDNLSADPEQDYFADGITEDITTELSKIDNLFVIARNSAFVYRKKPVSVRQIGRELGVRYALEGSVRKAGNRVRINAQLIDTANEHHVWADRIDGELSDVFALQDTVTRHVVRALAARLATHESPSRHKPETASFDAYDHVLRATSLYYRFTIEDNLEARRLLEAAIALDPAYARAYAVLADCHLQMWHQFWNRDRQATIEPAARLAAKALSLGGAEALAHATLANVKIWRFQHDEAVADIDRAIALEPNSANYRGLRAIILSWSGRHAEALPEIDHAMQLDPNHGGWASWVKGHALLFLGRLEEAVAEFKAGIARQREFMPLHIHLVVALWQLGRRDEARAALAAVPSIRPEYALDVPYRRAEDRDLVLAAARAVA